MTEIVSFAHAGATLIAEISPANASAEPDGPSYVLLHGIGMGRTIFAELIEHLGDGGRVQTIAIDLPGYGTAPEPARVLTMERTADLVAAFLRGRGGAPAVIVGHSMGAQIALEGAARHPELVDRVVLIGPTVNRRERTARRQILRLAQDLLVESPRVIVIGAREYLRAGPSVRRKFRAMLAHAPELTCPRVLAPALVIRGANDYVSSRAWCRFLVASLPDGRLAEVDGHGHETMIRDATPSAELIRGFAAGADGAESAAVRRMTAMPDEGGNVGTPP